MSSSSNSSPTSSSSHLQQQQQQQSLTNIDDKKQNDNNNNTKSHQHQPHLQNPKLPLLTQLLSPPYPQKPKTHIHHRSDEISYHNTLGVLFLMEMSVAGAVSVESFWDYNGGSADGANFSSASGGLMRSARENANYHVQRHDSQQHGDSNSAPASTDSNQQPSATKPLPPPLSIKYLVFLPYTSLMVLNPRHVVHMKANGELVNKVKVKYDRTSTDEEEYVSARISNGGQQQAAEGNASKQQQQQQEQQTSFANNSPSNNLALPPSMPVRVPKLNLAIVVPLKELHSIEVNQKNYGWSSVKLKQLVGANSTTSLGSQTGGPPEKKKSWGPLVFQDGGLQNFLDQLECHMQFYKIPHNNTIFMKEKSHSLDKSVKLMEFDDYFSDVLREEGTSGNSFSSAANASASGAQRSGGLLEWGAKLSKEVSNIQVGIKRYFGGNNKEQQTKDALKKLKKEREERLRASSIDQKIITNPDEAKDSDEDLHDEDDFEIIDPVKENLVPPEWNIDPGKSISLDEWHSKWINDSDGKVINPKALKKEIFYRGIQEEARGEIWPFLLGFYPWDSTREERTKILEEGKKRYNLYKQQWESITEEQASRHSLFRERSHRVEKDVVRTDRTNPLYADDDSEYLNIIYRVLLTYAWYNFDLGYCQGMGDFLSPLLSVVKDEVLTYCCYSALMDSRAHQNFHKDSSGMEAQLQSLLNILKSLDYGLYVYLESRDALNLFFCFRWILVNFKREFSYEDIKRIWESFWTNEWGENMHLFMCYAILNQHRDTFIEKGMGFDDILQFCVDLNMKMDAKEVVTKTMYSILEYKRLVESKGSGNM